MNILDGLRSYREVSGAEARADVSQAQRKAHEYLLLHHLYQSHRTGQPMRKEFTQLAFPPRWHFDVLRGLDYLQSVVAPRDERLADAIQIIKTRRHPDGYRPLQQTYKGQTHFQMEKTGGPS